MDWSSISWPEITAIAQILAAIATFVLAYFACKQIRHLEEERVRKLVIDAAIAGECLRMLITVHYQLYYEGDEIPTMTSQ